MGKGREVDQAWTGLAGREKRQCLHSQNRVAGDKAQVRVGGLVWEMKLRLFY